MIEFLRLGTLCKLIYEEIIIKEIILPNSFNKSGEERLRRSRFNTIVLLEGSISAESVPGSELGLEAFLDKGINEKSRGSKASKIINGKINLDFNIQKAAEKLSSSPIKFKFIKKYTTKYIYNNLNSIEEFFISLKKLIDNIPYTEYRKNLRKFCEYDCLDDKASNNVKKELLARCVLYALKAPNKISEYNIKSASEYNLESGDPHARRDISVSTALSIYLVNDMFKEEPYNQKHNNLEFYHFETCVEYIIENNLLIKNIKVKYGKVFVYVEKTNYNLKRLSNLDYDNAVEFLKKYAYEFKSKVSWHGMTIDELAKKGLQQGKWLVYGYYDSDKLIAYLDYKFRVDKDIELGALLIDKDYRKNGLAASLIHLFRLMFPTFCLTAGTYAENKGMIKTFRATGFQKNIHNDGSYLKKDRINPKYSLDDKEHYTYSKYFYAKSLLEYVTEKDNKKTKIEIK